MTIQAHLRIQILLHESGEAGEKWSKTLALSFRV